MKKARQHGGLGWSEALYPKMGSRSRRVCFMVRSYEVKKAASWRRENSVCPSAKNFNSKNS